MDPAVAAVRLTIKTFSFDSDTFLELICANLSWLCFDILALTLKQKKILRHKCVTNVSQLGLPLLKNENAGHRN
jgi:hypothetical protein